MKQKKIDKVIEEYRKNGNKNLEAKLINNGANSFWCPSQAINISYLMNNIAQHRYKYRIKKIWSDSTGLTVEQTNKLFEEFHKMLDKQGMKAVIATPDKDTKSNCKMSPEAIESVLKQFDKDQSSDNLQVEVNNEYRQSIINRAGLENNIKRFGMVYRVKPNIANTNQLPLMPPTYFSDKCLIQAAALKPGKYYLNTVYFNSIKDAEVWLDFMKKFEVSI